MNQKQKQISLDVPFEKALQSLEKIVNELEGGNITLDKSLDNFEEGMGLAKFCEEKLNAASGRVEKITRDFSGNEKITIAGDDDGT